MQSKVLRELQSQYLEALRLGSGRQADRVVQTALDQAIPVGEVYLDIFQPVAYEIGQLWQRNEFSVAQEHLATAIMERQMGDIHALFRATQIRARTLVLGCVAEEWHRLGARMVADFFEQDGWTVHYLGAAVPTETLVATPAHAAGAGGPREKSRLDRPVGANGLSRADDCGIRA
jgi:methanogenic corrinoid protein MtbC1